MDLKGLKLRVLRSGSVLAAAILVRASQNDCHLVSLQHGFDRSLLFSFSQEETGRESQLAG